MITKNMGLILLTILCVNAVWAEEESFDLDKEVAPPKIETQKHSSAKSFLMGRVDLTAEISPYRPESDEKQTSLKNNHFLIFLKAKPSDKTSFMGEFVRQSFYFVDYSWIPNLHVLFGKIIVPFGDTRRFHHMYGGIQGYSANGVMFPNVWAEPGLNASFGGSHFDVDIYTVNSISSESSITDPDLQKSTTQRQAGGTRITFPISKKVTAITSVYYGQFLSGKDLVISGGDIYSDYGALDSTLFRYLRLAMGVANASIHQAPVSGSYEKRGDYLEFDTNVLGFGEVRARYGTYINNSREQSKNDVHNFNLGYFFDIDVVHILTEYQWNFEAKDEISNDVARVSASLDF